MEKKFTISYIDVYLAIHDETRYDVSKKTGIPESTLRNAAKNLRGTNGVSGASLKAIAKTIEKTPGQVLDDLLVVEEALENLEENRPFTEDSGRYWTLINDKNVIWTDGEYIKSQIVFAMTEWLKMVKEPEEDREFTGEFYEYVWSVQENDDDFYFSDKNGNEVVF